jgi:F-box/WD-40 domain protein 7
LDTLRGHSGPVLAIQAQGTRDLVSGLAQGSTEGSGTRLISGSADKTVRIWNLESGVCEGILEGHKDAVTCLTIDSSEVRIITGSLDRTIKVWSISSLECLRTLDWMSSEGHTGVIRCLQADEWRIISAADDKTIKVWDLNTGQRLVTLKSHTDGVTCLQFNDFYIVSGSYDKTVKLWDFTVC